MAGSSFAIEKTAHHFIQNTLRLIEPIQAVILAVSILLAIITIGIGLAVFRAQKLRA